MRKSRQLGEFFHFRRCIRAKTAGNSEARGRESGMACKEFSLVQRPPPERRIPAWKNPPDRSQNLSRKEAALVMAGRRWPHAGRPGQSDNLGGGGPRRSKAKLVTRSDEAASPPETETKVGYRQPPFHSRWKPGQTGNPIGHRPRDILQEVLLSPFPVKIGAKIEMAPAINVMLLRIRARALEGDQKVIRSLIEHFGGKSLARSLASSSRK